MITFMGLSRQPKQKVLNLKNQLILTEEEEQVFDMLVFQRKSALEMSFAINKSVRSVFNIEKNIKTKIRNLEQYLEYSEKFDKYGIDEVRN